MKTIKLNSVYEKEMLVTENHLAISVKSGDVNVFATPMMIALMEQVSSKNLAHFLDESETSVGVEISTSHLAATPMGMKVRAVSKITEIDGKKITFQIEAYDEKELIGKGTHTRVIVSKDKFEKNALAKLDLFM